MYQYGLEKEIVRKRKCTKNIIQLVIFYKTATGKLITFITFLKETTALLKKKDFYQQFQKYVGSYERN